ncbi:MAG TPA: c-type cytochrome [Opitutaceae bacterium]|nr:c-type cytochrome [Opitutaceae bacterium]
MLPRLPALVFLLGSSVAFAADSSAERGRAAYAVYCASCHQFAGEGVRGVFPPLASSDYLMADKERSIRIALQGTSGPIRVNDAMYNTVMPPPVGIDDQKVADVLTYVRTAWGNRGDAVTVAEVQAMRGKIAAEQAQKPDPYAPLPAAPAGFKIREVAKLPVHGVRLASMPGANWILVLNNLGDIYRLDPATGDLTRVLGVEEYANVGDGVIAALGMTIDSKKRLYVATNQRVPEYPVDMDRVVIFRSEPLGAAGEPKLRPWLRTSYPWGVGPYNHGVGHMAEGPDGLLYVVSGSRTDGGEAGTDPNLFKGGETEITAGIWQLNPNDARPAIKMYARGIRNAWSFAWTDKGELFSASNGPDADFAEEMDHIEEGKHYGFPYQFADTEKRPYAHTPVGPPGLKFTYAVRNFGPAAGGSPDNPMATFHPHSSPAGMVFCGADWPESVRGKMLIGRFGNFLGDYNVGFDILAATLTRNAAGAYEARMDTFLAPLGRPIDLLQVGKKLYILEYTRPTDKTSNRPMTPGRILELSW